AHGAQRSAIDGGGLHAPERGRSAHGHRADRCSRCQCTALPGMSPAYSDARCRSSPSRQYSRTPGNAPRANGALASGLCTKTRLPPQPAGRLKASAVAYKHALMPEASAPSNTALLTEAPDALSSSDLRSKPSYLVSNDLLSTTTKR